MFNPTSQNIPRRDRGSVGGGCIRLSSPRQLREFALSMTRDNELVLIVLHFPKLSVDQLFKSQFD